MEKNNKEVTVVSDEMDGMETSTQNKFSSMQMENKNKQKEVMHTPRVDEEDDILTSTMQEKLRRLRSFNSKCCIYKVPEFIRKEKEECYRPAVISIGPIFYQDRQLETMQQVKWIFLESFLRHPKNACRSLDSYLKTVRGLNKDIRDCYQEQKMLPCDDELVKMIVLDAVFLLTVFMFPANDDRTSVDHSPDYRPLPREITPLGYFMVKDLFLEENQLPFFVLKDIFGKAFPTEGTSLLIDLIRRFICRNTLPGSESMVVVDSRDPPPIEHLLDFWWKCCCFPIVIHQLKEQEEQEQVAVTVNGEAPNNEHHATAERSTKRKVTPTYVPLTAKQLSAAGVKFKLNDSYLLDIKFDKSTGELRIPRLVLNDNTETLFRSILFFEQYHYRFYSRTCFIDFVFFLDALIDTDEDVQILQQHRIFANMLGSVDKKVADIFNNLNKNNEIYGYNYSGVCEDLNAYANKSCNRWMAILRRDYFSHPWSILSVIFATIVFILTLLQTITSFTKK